MSATEPKSAWLARDWAQAIAPYRRASAARGIFELAITFPPFVAVWTAIMIAAQHGQFWLSFALAPLAAGLLIRLFIIQHDCGHGSFFPSKFANDWVGRAIGVLTMTPYDHWRRCHAIHHATSGNLDRRGIGDIKTLTVHEYFARDWRGRLAYRLYRHPLVMFGLGPAYVFLFENRLPLGFMRKGAMPWLSTMTTNAGILLAAGLLMLHASASRRSSSSMCRLLSSPRRWVSGCSTSSINSKQRHGMRLRIGASLKRRCTAARITICRLCCDGSAPISACITCITCRAASPFIAFPRSCGPIPSFARLGGSRCGAASFVSVSRCGTRKRVGCCRFARRGRRTPTVRAGIPRAAAPISPSKPRIRVWRAAKADSR